MSVPTASPLRTVLPATVWTGRQASHVRRADALTAARRERRSRQQTHAVEDFLFEYYALRPAALRRWHPGHGAVLAAAGPSEDLAGGDADGEDSDGEDSGGGDSGGGDAAREELAQRARWRWHRHTDDGGVELDSAAFVADRGAELQRLLRILEATAARPAQLGCLGLHEWAMVYRQTAEERRHDLPLRLGPDGTDAVVEAHPVRCSHFDAFRFFTADARPLNRLQPTREDQAALEQPGCLHANMDLLRAALTLGPVCPGELLLDCFELARDIRVLDMRASPYDVTALGHRPVEIETADGRAEYVAAQGSFSERSAPLRERLIAVLAGLPLPH